MRLAGEDCEALFSQWLDVRYVLYLFVSQGKELLGVCFALGSVCTVCDWSVGVRVDEGGKEGASRVLGHYY